MIACRLPFARSLKSVVHAVASLVRGLLAGRHVKAQTASWHSIVSLLKNLIAHVVQFVRNSKSVVHTVTSLARSFLTGRHFKTIDCQLTCKLTRPSSTKQCNFLCWCFRSCLGSREDATVGLLTHNEWNHVTCITMSDWPDDHASIFKMQATCSAHCCHSIFGGRLNAIP